MPPVFSLCPLTPHNTHLWRLITFPLLSSVDGSPPRPASTGPKSLNIQSQNNPRHRRALSPTRERLAGEPNKTQLPTAFKEIPAPTSS